MNMSPSKELDKFIIRLPDGMREQIAQAAKENERTMNAEIIYRLKRSFHTELPIPFELCETILWAREQQNAANKTNAVLDQIMENLGIPTESKI